VIEVSTTYQDDGSVRARSGVRRVVRPTDAPEWGECTRCEIEFDDIGELDAHMAREHPRQCSRTECRKMAAYRTAPGSRYSGACYCAEHMDKVGHSPWSAYGWVLDPANDDAPRLSPDHPVEAANRGLFGSRGAAQEERFGEEVLD
jgi:hypothetical protein